MQLYRLHSGACAQVLGLQAAFGPEHEASGMEPFGCIGLHSHAI